MNFIPFTETLREKAKAFAEKSKQNKQDKHVEIAYQSREKLPTVNSSNKTNENVISEYMNVLRSTHQTIGQKLCAERVKKKKEKKLDNVNFLINQQNFMKNANSLRRKIKKMRKERIFPQPKSYTNYRNRNGLLKKNSIKIER